MRKSRVTESEIVEILKEGTPGSPWRSCSGRTGSPGQLLQLEDQVRRRLGRRPGPAQGAGGGERQAQAAVCRDGPGECGHQGCPEPKTITPSAKRQVVAILVGEHRLPVQRACRIAGLSRAAHYRPPHPDPERTCP
jgi:putative transposase